jgi:hypothetical protein
MGDKRDTYLLTDVAVQIASLVVAAVGGLLAGGWWARANERQKQLREVMLKQAEVLRVATGDLVTKLSPWKMPQWPPVSAIVDEPAAWARRMEEAEAAANGAASQVVGITALYFRSRTIDPASNVVFWTRRAAMAGRDLSKLTETKETVSEEDTEVFRHHAAEAWAAYHRLCGDLQMDLVSFQSPLGRWIHRRRDLRRSEEAVREAERQRDEYLGEVIPVLQEANTQMNEAVARAVRRTTEIEQRHANRLREIEEQADEPDETG